MCLSDLTGFSTIIFILSLLVTHLIVVDFIAHIWVDLWVWCGFSFRLNQNYIYENLRVRVRVRHVFLLCGLDWNWIATPNTKLLDFHFISFRLASHKFPYTIDKFHGDCLHRHAHTILTCTYTKRVKSDRLQSNRIVCI